MLELTLKDALLVPLYIVLFISFFRFLNTRLNARNGYKRYFMLGLSVKILVAVVFGVFSIFILPGDTEMYYTAGIDFKNIVFEDINNARFITGEAKDFGNYYESKGLRPENYGYVSAESNLMAVKFVALFSVFSWNNYLIISLFFSLFSFWGLWSMFKTFCRIYPSYHKQIFFIFFLMPSLLFWGSGILKDTLCIGFLGIGLYNSYLFFFEKQYKIQLLLTSFISFYFLYLTKPYIAIAFVPSFLLWYFIRFIGKEENVLVKVLWVSIPVFCLLIFLVFGDLNEIVADYSAESISNNISAVRENYIRSTPEDGALIDYGEIVPTPLGILRLVPKALVATLFRPFFWEAHKITSFLAAIEGTFFFIFTIVVLFRRGIVKSLGIIFSDNTIFFCFIFSMVFAIAIGLNCFNLGTLVRYKIPCMPFYMLTLFLILKKQRPSVPAGTISGG